MVDILYFFTRTCQPCKLLKPKVEAFGLEDGITIQFIDASHEQNLELVQEYEVRTVPTIILRRDGDTLVRANAATWTPQLFREAIGQMTDLEEVPEGDDLHKVVDSDMQMNLGGGSLSTPPCTCSLNKESCDLTCDAVAPTEGV